MPPNCATFTFYLSLQVTSLNQGLTKLEMETIAQNASALATAQWLERVQKQLDAEEDQSDDRHLEVVNEIGTLMDELKSRHDTLNEVLDDVRAIVDLNNNRTSEKGMTLMGQIALINTNLTQLKDQLKSQGDTSDRENGELRDWVQDIDGQLEAEIEYSKRKDQDLEEKLTSLQEDLDTESSDLSTRLDDLQVQLEVQGNKTEEKDMVLMAEISYTNSKVADLMVGLEDANVEVASNNKSIRELSQRLSDDKSALLEAIDDVQTQLNMNHNKTSQKGMTLMDQIADLNQQIARIDSEAEEEAASRSEGDAVISDLLRDVETDLLRQLRQHRDDTTEMENRWSDQGWIWTRPKKTTLRVELLDEAEYIRGFRYSFSNGSSSFSSCLCRLPSSTKVLRMLMTAARQMAF